MAYSTAANEPELVVLDAVNPVRPVQDCTLSPAAGGRFIDGTRIAFWVGNSLRVADIGTGAVAATATLPVYPSDVAFSRDGAGATGAFSRDGSLFAYRVGDYTNSISTHLFIAGRDRTLVTRAGIGGRGGTPPNGPLLSQLEFSADGKYLLSIDSFGAVFGGPPTFVVYDQNGSTVFQSTTAVSGRWAMQGSKLYFIAEGDLQSWDPIGGELRIVHDFSSCIWPMVSPDNRRILTNCYDAEGLPHLWSVDLATGVFAQLATGISTYPVFVGTRVAWSTEEARCNCVPGGDTSLRARRTESLCLTTSEPAMKRRSASPEAGNRAQIRDPSSTSGSARKRLPKRGGPRWTRTTNHFFCMNWELQARAGARGFRLASRPATAGPRGNRVIPVRGSTGSTPVPPRRR